MADNVQITAGSGTTIGTDEVAVNGGSVVHVQYVKLVDGTGNGTDGLPGTAANGLDVDVTRVIPGTTATALGKAEDAAHTDGDVGVMALAVRNATVAGTDGDYTALNVDDSSRLVVVPRRDLQRVSVQSAGLTTATTAYTAGDQVGTIFTLTGMARANGGSGVITSVALVDAQDIIGAYDVVLFEAINAAPTLAADNAAFAISDTDALTARVISLTGAYDIGNNRVAQALNLAVPYVCGSTTTSLFAALQTKTGHTFFSGGVGSLQLIVHYERN